jgi:hypothetical protein
LSYRRAAFRSRAFLCPIVSSRVRPVKGDCRKDETKGMKFAHLRRSVVVAIALALLAFAAPSMAANPGDVEFTPGGPTLYLQSPPTINWAAYGALTGATCQFSRISPSASTPFPTASCAAAAASAPVVNTASAPTFTGYTWNTAPLISGDGAYRITYKPSFVSFGSPTITRDFVIDTLPPVVTASAPIGLTADNTPELGYTMSDVNPDRVECAVDPVDPSDPGSYSPCPASPYSPPTLADGEHIFYAIGYDLAQHLAVAVRTFVVDATGPVITVAGIREGEIIPSAWPPLSVSWRDAGAGAQGGTCAYDSAPPTNCGDAAFMNAPLKDGSHTLSVTATDVLGNVSALAIHFRTAGFAAANRGLAPPTAGKFALKRGTRKGTKFAATLKVSFDLPPGAPETACSGSARFGVLAKRKKIGSAAAKLRNAGRKCTATAAARLAKKFRGKKLSIVFTYSSGPISPFTLRGSGRL